MLRDRVLNTAEGEEEYQQLYSRWHDIGHPVEVHSYSRGDRGFGT